jgi:hypothetical protein
MEKAELINKLYDTAALVALLPEGYEQSMLTSESDFVEDVHFEWQRGALVLTLIAIRGRRTHKSIRITDHMLDSEVKHSTVVYLERRITNLVSNLRKIS